MDARFRVGPYDVEVSSLKALGDGSTVFFAIKERPEEVIIGSQYITPGEPFCYGPSQEPYIRALMHLPKTEARAIASAIMGAAAEL